MTTTLIGTPDPEDSPELLLDMGHDCQLLPGESTPRDVALTGELTDGRMSVTADLGAASIVASYDYSDAGVEDLMILMGALPEALTAVSTRIQEGMTDQT